MIFRATIAKSVVFIVRVNRHRTQIFDVAVICGERRVAADRHGIHVDVIFAVARRTSRKIFVAACGRVIVYPVVAVFRLVVSSEIKRIVLSDRTARNICSRGGFALRRSDFDSRHIRPPVFFRDIFFMIVGEPYSHMRALLGCYWI